MAKAVILALVVLGAVVGGAMVVGAPVFAIPIVAVLLAGWGAYELGRRGLRRGPQRDEPIRFTEEDRRTLVPTPSADERRRNRREAARAARR
jgi:hypothetical protein